MFGEEAEEGFHALSKQGSSLKMIVAILGQEECATDKGVK
jgi:hypothetical protein